MELSDKSRHILELISKGHSYGQILLLNSTYTYLDIFKSAKEVLDICTSLEDDISAHEKRINEIREKYPNAYEKWTEEQERILMNLYDQGVPVHAIATTLKRQSGAIRSRIQKLGLDEDDIFKDWD